jgi:hypothetical protein
MWWRFEAKPSKDDGNEGQNCPFANLDWGRFQIAVGSRLIVAFPDSEGPFDAKEFRGPSSLSSD